MKKQNYQTTPKKLMEMIKKGELKPSPYQRASGQWKRADQSLLFNSMINDYIIPPLYFSRSLVGYDAKERPIYETEIVDGLQRITTCIAFLSGEFALDPTTPAIMTDDGPVEIGGKYFDELPEKFKDDIRTFSFTAYNLEDFTDEEIEEIFFRLNNGVALTKSQQSKAKMGMDLAKFISDMLSKNFYTETAYFTDSQLRRANDQLTLIQGMALLDAQNGDYEMKTGISEAEMFKYCESLRGNYPQEKRDKVEAILDYLSSTFSGLGKEKFMKKINIPMVILMADKAIKENVNSVDFLNWFHSFEESYKPSCGYANYCGSGSVKTANTLKRIEIMGKSFNTYMEDIKKDNGLAEEGKEAQEAQEVEDNTEVQDNEDDVIIDDTFPMVEPTTDTYLDVDND